MRQLLTVTKSVARTLLHPEGVTSRSSKFPQSVSAICDRCSATTVVLSGPPNSEVKRDVTCKCGNAWKCTVERGAM